MATILAASDASIVRGLGDYAKAHLGDVTIVRGYPGIVSRPATPDYVLITPVTRAGTSTNRHSYDAEAGTAAISAPAQHAVQIDCYGKHAEVWAKSLCILLRDWGACEFTAGYGFAPCYTNDARNMAQDRGRGVYEPRWMFECVVHGVETVTTDQEFLDGVNIHLRRATGEDNGD